MADYSQNFDASGSTPADWVFGTGATIDVGAGSHSGLNAIKVTTSDPANSSLCTYTINDSAGGEVEVIIWVYLTADYIIGPFTRAAGSNTQDTGWTRAYGVLGWRGAGGGIKLSKWVSGTRTDLVTHSGATLFPSSTWCRLSVKCQGTTISAKAYRTDTNQWLNSSGAWASGEQNFASVTDSSVAGAGKSGVVYYGTSGQTAYADTFSIDELGSAPVAGTLAYSNLTSTSVDLDGGTITGGTVPYSAQLKLSTNGGGTYSNSGSPITGDDTPDWTGVTLTQGTTYHVKYSVTDGAAIAADSNVVTFTTPSSPLLSISGPTYGTTGTVSGTFTVTASTAPGSNLTVNLSVSGITGTFSGSGTATILSGQTSATFTFTPSSVGLGTITAAGSSYVSGTTKYASLASTGVALQPYAAPYGESYPGLESSIGWTVINAATGTVLIPRTTGETTEYIDPTTNDPTGIYVMVIPIDETWTPVIIIDAPAGAVPFVY